ncbi:MAG: hypothetical protein AAGJ31_14985, partial [Verrucomicrobiota bacterium]
MSLAAVTELSHELRRLAVAGASLAPGDHRIAKLVPILQKSGEKVPVFSTIADASQALVDSTRTTAAPALLRTNALVLAVLKTQGKSSVEGEITPLKRASLTGNQPISARLLEDVKTALTQSGEGRLETIRIAFQDGYFGDIRLAEAAVAALKDNSHELANLAAKELVPPYGPGIGPLLLDHFDPREKKAGARVLCALQGCHPEEAASLSRVILDGGKGFRERFHLGEEDEPSIEVRAAALECLTDSEADQGVLLDHLKAKNKPLRVAALSRLIDQGHPDAESLLLEKLQGSATKVREAVESLPAVRSAQILDAVKEKTEGFFKTVKDAKLVEVNTLLQLILAVAKSEPDEQSLPLAIRAMDEWNPIRKRYENESWSARENLHRTELSLLRYLHRSEEEEAGEAIIRNFSGLSDAHLAVGLAAVLSLSGPRETWKRLGETIRKATKRHYAYAINHLFDSYFAHHLKDFELPPAKEWNPEWLRFGNEHEMIGWL